VFQRRQNGSVDFYRDWASYETGFGDLMGEFWLGNRFIYSITNQSSYELMVNMSDFDGNSAYATYNVFNVGNAASMYLLTVNGYSGNAGDSLDYHNNMKFSTYDKDNDKNYANCAESYKGAWWYKSCSNSNLNGRYYDRGTHTSGYYGLLWRLWKGWIYSLKSTTMSTQEKRIQDLEISQEQVRLDLPKCIDNISTVQEKMETREKRFQDLAISQEQVKMNLKEFIDDVKRISIEEIQENTAVREQIVSHENDLRMLMTVLNSLYNIAVLSMQEIGTDCGDISGTTSGVYRIKPQGVEEPFSVYCDIQTEGDGWTVFQRRQDGSVDFYQDWASYETGFGDMMGEFWLGNSFIYSITNQGSYELNVAMSDFEGNSAYAHYNVFKVGNASSNYLLTVSGYSGNAGDSLAYHNNMKFSTHDRDHDRWSDVHCAERCKGGWWYNSCHHSNLNGEYHHTSNWDSLRWNHWGGWDSLKSTTMSARRRP
ncbi:hypothetical protein ScPMuIL_010386, partial [Solemya velum]